MHQLLACAFREGSMCMCKACEAIEIIYLSHKCAPSFTDHTFPISSHTELQ